MGCGDCLRSLLVVSGAGGWLAWSCEGHIRIRPVLVGLDCSCVWDTCSGAVCCGCCGRLTGRYSWQSLDTTLPLLAFRPSLSFGAILLMLVSFGRVRLGVFCHRGRSSL